MNRKFQNLTHLSPRYRPKSSGSLGSWPPIGPSTQLLSPHTEMALKRTSSLGLFSLPARTCRSWSRSGGASCIPEWPFKVVGEQGRTLYSGSRGRGAPTIAKKVLFVGFLSVMLFACAAKRT